MVKCNNCKCEIEEYKKFLHERLCSQNIKYCDICKEGIIKEEYEEHCLEHNNKKEEEIKINTEEEKNSLSLKKVQSSKIGCQYCGFFLSFDELTEHEEICGSRTTECKICKKFVVIKNFENHILIEHGFDKEIYDEYIVDNNNEYIVDDNNDLNNNFDKNKNPNDLWLKEELSLNSLSKMTSDQQLAYALSLSMQ